MNMIGEAEGESKTQRILHLLLSDKFIRLTGLGIHQLSFKMSQESRIPLESHPAQPSRNTSEIITNCGAF